MRSKPYSKMRNNAIFSFCFLIFILLLTTTTHSSESADSKKTSKSSASSSSTSTSKAVAPAAATSVSASADIGATSTGGGSGTVTPDLFTGMMSTGFPIEVPPGRKGMQPNLALTYRSNSGNGWVGVGWDLELGAIERSTKNGVKYGSDDHYVLRIAGAGIDLVNIGNYEYRAKIEGGFLRIIQKNPSTQNAYWIVTDKSGMQYFYGQDYRTRQDYPVNDPNAQGYEIFKWCLDYVLDTNGNFMKMSYYKASGQIYPDLINYTGNVDGTLTTNYVRFYREGRTDAPVMYTTNFAVTTGSRLKSIDVFANGNRVRTYTLTYDYSASTSSSLLTSVQQSGNDATTALPAQVFTYSAATNGFDCATWSTETDDMVNDQYNYVVTGDFNGDSKTDIAITRPGWNYFKMRLSNAQGNGFDSATWSTDPDDMVNDKYNYVVVGDFNGDGKTDIAITRPGWNYFKMRLSNAQGNGFDSVAWSTDADGMANDGNNYVLVGDFNGDGKTDIAITRPGWNYFKMRLSNAQGNGFDSATWSTDADGMANDGLNYVLVGDFNGDGKTDIAITRPGWSYFKMRLSNAQGNGFDSATWSTAPNDLSYYGQSHVITGDFNGDGKTDIAITYVTWGNWQIRLSQGSSFISQSWSTYGSNSGKYQIPGDFNGDGKTDILMAYIDEQYWPMRLSVGNGFASVWWMALPCNYDRVDYFDESIVVETGDFNGDGKTDFAITLPGWNRWKMLTSAGSVPDLLVNVSNGSGGNTSIAYKPSTAYSNTLLPYPVQTVSSVTVCDNYDATVTPSCKGTESKTTYEYSGGFFHIGEREFRGFNYVKVTGPAGPHNEQAIAETWFHQGNETDVIPENSTFDYLKTLANVPDGSMKGKPYRTRTSDARNRNDGGLTAVFAETAISYKPLPDGTAPSPPYYYYNPPLQVDVFNCDGTAYGQCGDPVAQHVRTVYTYDGYGNVTQEDQYGDTADPKDDRTVVRNFVPSQNTTAWIMALPASETIYQGIGTSAKVSETKFYYDGVLDCNTAATDPRPTKGNLTLIMRSLDGINDPTARMAYDQYGNLICSRDPRGNVSTVSYDSSFTFPTITTPPVGTSAQGYQTKTQYYGVDSVKADTGLYGEVKSVTDSNGAVSTTEYDTLGRKTKITAPDGTWMSWSYPITPGTGTSSNVFGVVGVQNIQTDTAAGISSWTYFDGLGRAIIEKKTGSAGKIIVSETTYDRRGAAAQVSVPYFEGEETPGVTIFTYDSAGRIIHADNPDGTSVDSCYRNGVTVTIDADKHRKRQTKNVRGKLVKVEEYLGTYATGCTTDVGALYATTTYDYDVLGNLRFVTDNAGNKTEMHYDNLGRKDYMRDPDLGYWTYAYDANGNLIKQTDARGQVITFTYDALNRVTKKHYPRLTFGPDVVYTYDVAPASYPTYTTYPIGRLTTMTDGSGTSTFFYDTMGRTVKTIQKVSGTDYPIDYGYALGRLASIKYPDGDVVSYSYDSGGHLTQVSDPSTNKVYAAYANFDAFAQPENATYGNGVMTVYQYNPVNKRLLAIHTLDPIFRQLLSLTYDYSYRGNVTAITDNLDSTRSQRFTYDEINRLSQAQSISYGTQLYSYDKIGNILSKEGVSYNYADLSGSVNKPHAVKSTSDGKTYTYDANGNMISSGVQSINYDYDNLPRSVILNGSTITFVYDGAGARVKKTSSSGTTIYVGKLYECNSSGCSKYIFAGGTRIALKTPADTLYYHQDHLGSSSVITDSAGAKVEEIHYLPFGGTQSDMGSLSVNHKFNSQEFDPETGLYYYNARYYNPALGRFISPDSVVPDFSNPQSFNRYSYVLNNPLLYTDPTGHSFWRNFITAVVTAAVIVACDGVCGPETMALAGMAGGATNAALNRQNILEGALMGQFMGAGMFSISTALGPFGPAFNWAVTIGSGMYSYRRRQFRDFAGGFLGAMTGSYGAQYAIDWGPPQDVGGPHSKQRELIDVDPDGEWFKKPTYPGKMRDCDTRGCGYYGASRDNGTRPHLGIDIISDPGEFVFSPVNGTAYPMKYPGVRIITNDWTIEILYMKPSFGVSWAGAQGLEVSRGVYIGYALDITGKYRGIANHLHFQMRPNDSSLYINPTPFLYP